MPSTSCAAVIVGGRGGLSTPFPGLCPGLGSSWPPAESGGSPFMLLAYRGDFLPPLPILPDRQGVAVSPGGAPERGRGAVRRLCLGGGALSAAMEGPVGGSRDKPR